MMRRVLSENVMRDLMRLVHHGVSRSILIILLRKIWSRFVTEILWNKRWWLLRNSLSISRKSLDKHKGQNIYNIILRSLYSQIIFFLLLDKMAVREYYYAHENSYGTDDFYRRRGNIMDHKINHKSSERK